MNGIDWDKLPEVLGEHRWDLSEWDVHKPLNRCTCGANVGNAPHEFTAHLAAVVRAWVEGQMTEEWGIQYERTADPTMDNPSGEVTATMILRDESHTRQVMASPAPLSGRNKRAIRRFVTPWAPVEGDKP